MNSQQLTDSQIRDFIDDGFVRIDGAFSRTVAEDACRLLWPDAGCDPDAPETWTQPVIRLGLYGQEPFVAAANTPLLHKAFDQLVGQAHWLPPRNLGTFVIRFPSQLEPQDTGWHIDVSFGTEDPDFLNWRANVASRGRALLMLFLFTDVGTDDAPTRIRAGSHLDIARMLAPAGEQGLSLRELAANDFAATAHRPEILATGAAGTVYLCHPFLVHRAQTHRGKRPRVLAQPPLLPSRPFVLERKGSDYSPVEVAIRNALP
jgi:hypothetical protein